MPLALPPLGTDVTMCHLLKLSLLQDLGSPGPGKPMAPKGCGNPSSECPGVSLTLTTVANGFLNNLYCIFQNVEAESCSC